MSFDFNKLHMFLSNWPNESIEGVPLDSIFERIVQILESSKRKGKLQKMQDLLPLLRQAMLRHRASLNCAINVTLEVPQTKDWPDENIWKEFGFFCVPSGEFNFKISALPWKPEWLSHAQDFDVLGDAYENKDCRPDISMVIDPCVRDAAGPDFDRYSSEGQREAIRGSFFMPSGSTLVVNLPTGTGKSLVGYLPSLLGDVEGNFTLFIVPTIALSMDQAEKLRAIYVKTGSRHAATPLAWHSGISDDAKKVIKNNIRNGLQPILFTSPESVCGSLRWVLHEAARRCFLKYLVVDEAHLVSQWGIEFRPDFQALSGIWRGLLKESNDQLKTLLMTATLTQETLDTLQILFSSRDKPFQIISDTFLRPEPRYWHYKATGFHDKNKCVLEAVRMGPRPLIVYVTEPKEAEEWFEIIKNEGFERIACFHGNTRSRRREEIIGQWNRNQLDIIVATSAFGVGMDKSDVRMILHATVPENLDRYYQEVGRGGRDKRATIAMLIYTQKDLDKARGMSLPRVVTKELGLSRWESMVKKRQPIDNNNLFRLDLRNVPPHGKQESDYNRAWNMRTLLLMVRSGAVQLEAEPPPLIDDENVSLSEEDVNNFFNNVVLRFLNGSHCDPEFWSTTVAMTRENSSTASQHNFSLLYNILEKGDDVGASLATLYSFNHCNYRIAVPHFCGGCPSCRSNDQVINYFQTLPVVPLRVLKDTEGEQWMSVFPMVPIHPVILSYTREEEQTLPKELPRILAVLVRIFGVREVVSSCPEKLMQECEFRQLYKQAPDRFIIHRHLDEDAVSEYVSDHARVTILYPWGMRSIPNSVLLTPKRFHLIIAPVDIKDGDHPHRLFCAVAKNILTFSQFKLRLQ